MSTPVPSSTTSTTVGSTDTTLYISLELAVAASTANSRSFRFSNLSGSSFISVWCGTNGTGRKVVEVEIDPAVPGTYRSTSPCNRRSRRIAGA